MKLRLYEARYREEVKALLEAFAAEVWDNTEATVDVDSFVKSHWAIYLALNTQGQVIGFSSYLINDYYGMHQAVVGNTYIYVKPEHRSSRVMYMFALQTGRVVEQLQLPLEHYYGSDESMRLSSKLKGAKIYEAHMYPVDEVAKTFNKLKNKVRIR